MTREPEGDAPIKPSAHAGRLQSMTLLTVDWVVVSSLATAAGTLVLAVATFSAVRSSNRSARIAEVALQEQRRPLLAPSRLERCATRTIRFVRRSSAP